MYSRLELPRPGCAGALGLHPQFVLSDRGYGSWGQARDLALAQVLEGHFVVLRDTREPGVICVWTGSSWVGDTDFRRPCSGGWIELEGRFIGRCSKLESDIVVSPGGVELNAFSNKGISEGFGVVELHKGVCGSPLPLNEPVDAGKCKVILLRTECGVVRY